MTLFCAFPVQLISIMSRNRAKILILMPTGGLSSSMAHAMSLDSLLRDRETDRACLPICSLTIARLGNFKMLRFDERFSKKPNGAKDKDAQRRSSISNLDLIINLMLDHTLVAKIGQFLI